MPIKKKVLQFPQPNADEQYATEGLRLHPLQEKVYGRELADPALVESIRTSGIIEPLIVDQNNQIISGSRRWRSALELKLPHVHIRRFVGSPLEAESLLINANLQREKSAGQKARESAELLRIEKVRAAERERAGITHGPQGAKGRASTIVAKSTGQSRATVEKQAEIVEKAEAGNKVAQSILGDLEADRTSLAEAHRQLKEAEAWEKEKEALADESEDDYTEEEKERLASIQKQQRDAREAAKRMADRQAAIKNAMVAEAKEIVSAGKKARALKMHPDHGGSSEGMQNLNSAAAWLLQKITTEETNRLSALGEVSL